MPAMTRQQIWKKADSFGWSGDWISKVEQQQHELMLACVAQYGDDAAARFKELSEALNQQLASDLTQNPDA